MNDFKTHILMTEFVTHDVKRFILEKPDSYQFVPGQATHLSIDLPGWREKKRPFTFTSRNKDRVLEFTIKGYPEHKGVTQKLHKLQPGAGLTIEPPFGTIAFKEKGVFLAGGAGITPFIAIFRERRQRGEMAGNRLIFSNKTRKDIILEKELKDMFSKQDLILTLTEESQPGYEERLVDKSFLKEYVEDFSQHFYICGPPGFEKAMKGYLRELGADSESITFES